MRSRIRRFARATLHIAAIAVIAVIATMTVQAHLEQQERAAFPPPGQMVDIGGGERIHVRTWGEREAGTPALILDASAAMPSSEWAWIGQMLGQGHFLVAYDRPGMAWSDGPKKPRDAASAARALTAALAVAHIEPPYVVIAHSYGGFSSRAFVGLNRDDVAGLVLLDTTNPNGGGGAGFAAFYRARAWQGHAALFRLFPPQNSFSSLPLFEQAPAQVVSHWRSHLDTTAEELEAWPASVADIRDLTFGDLPVLVVSARGSAAHLDLQRDMLGVSGSSDYVELDVDHVGMLLVEDQARLSSDAIEGWLGEL